MSNFDVTRCPRCKLASLRSGRDTVWCAGKWCECPRQRQWRVCCHHGGLWKRVGGDQVGTADGPRFFLVDITAESGVVQRNLASALTLAPASVAFELSWQWGEAWCKGRTVGTNGGLIFDVLKAGHGVLHRAEVLHERQRNYAVFKAGRGVAERVVSSEPMQAPDYSFCCPTGSARRYAE